MNAPRLAPAVVTQEPTGEFTVRVQWQPQPDLDRLDCYAWSCGKARTAAALAERLRRAVDAGVVVIPTSKFTDINGARGWHSRCNILARIMNADLRRLGF